MYSVVLAAMLTTTPSTPSWGWGCHGCHGCHGCYSCHGCHGCWGSCYGCSGCYGCYGWGGGYYGGWGNYAFAPGWPTWYGCGGSAFGCAGGGYACIGCFGCYGWGGYVAATPVLPARGVEGGDRMPPASAAAAPATVVVQLPPDARLYVEGKAVALDEQHSFTTPRLQTGAPYNYTLKAQAVRNGRLVNATKDIEVRAGETTRVAFRDLEAVAARNPEEASPPASARITVKLPQDAKLYVNDVYCPTRAFDTPKLDPERSYRYTLKAEYVRDGRAQTESKEVTFRAGQPVTVEFNRADARTVSR